MSHFFKKHNWLIAIFTLSICSALVVSTPAYAEDPIAAPDIDSATIDGVPSDSESIDAGSSGESSGQSTNTLNGKGNDNPDVADEDGEDNETKGQSSVAGQDYSASEQGDASSQVVTTENSSEQDRSEETTGSDSGKANEAAIEANATQENNDVEATPDIPIVVIIGGVVALAVAIVAVVVIGRRKTNGTKEEELANSNAE